MKPLLLLGLAGLVCQPAFSQSSDACNGAFRLLNLVKERIRPDLPREKLRDFQEKLATASRVCEDSPEIFYYREIIDRQLRDLKDADYSHKKLLELDASFQPSYSNPFTPLPVVNPATATDSKVAHKWALVVGINEFRAKTVTPLRFAVNDSQDFAKYLTDPKGGRFLPERVRILTNKEATLGGVRTGIGWLRANVQPDDLVVIYISSHGSPRDSDPNNVSYIIMNDTDLTDSSTLYATSLQMIDLVQQINREIKARRVVLFLDTCFSGDAFGDTADSGTKRIAPVPLNADAPASNAFSGALQTLKMGVGRAVITASRANEVSYEDPKLQHGYFTYYLIQTLQAKSQPLGDLFPQLRQQVMTSVMKDHSGATQTPSCEFSDRAATIVVDVPEGS